MKQGTIEKILEYYFHPDHSWMFGQDVRRAMDEFMGSKGTPLEPEATGHFSEWFLYDFKLGTGEAPLEYFYNKNPLLLSHEELSIYKSMQDNVYD